VQDLVVRAAHHPTTVATYVYPSAGLMMMTGCMTDFPVVPAGVMPKPLIPNLIFIGLETTWHDRVVYVPCRKYLQT
jgi:hypothetical protein